MKHNLMIQYEKTMTEMYKIEEKVKDDIKYEKRRNEFLEKKIYDMLYTKKETSSQEIESIKGNLLTGIIKLSTSGVKKLKEDENDSDDSDPTDDDIE